VLIFVESKNQGDMNRRRFPDCISQRNPLSLAQGKAAQVKIMLTPSSVYKYEKWQKRNRVVKLKFILMCFYFSLEYRLPYYKEGYNMMILTKPKCSKPREISRVIKGNQNSKVG
jgi:hypothetical protein